MSNFTVEDIPKIPPTIDLPDSAPPAVVEPVTGIPQSSAPPVRMMDQFGENPWDQEDQAFNEATAAWYREGQDKLDAAVLDPDKGFADIDLSFAADPETARRQVVADAWMDLNHDEPAAPSELQRRVQFQVASLAKFGEMVDNEDALFPLIQKDATRRKATAEVFSEIVKGATADSYLPPDKRKGMAGALAAVKGKPGDPGAAELADAWLAAGQKIDQRTAPFREELDHAWYSMTNGANIPRESLAAVTDEDWPEFLKALRLRAEALPDAEKETFLAGMRKDLLRQTETFGRQVGEEAMAIGLEQPTEPGVLFADAWQGTDNYRSSEADRKQEQADTQRERNRATEVRRIITEKFDVIDYVDGWGWAQKIPGVTVTSLTMAVPVLGQPAMAAAMNASAQESLYLKYRDAGMSEADSDTYSGLIAPAVMIPQMVLEKVGYGIWGRNMPGVSKAISAVGDRITNRAARFAVTGGIITAAEATVEVTQDFTKSVVEDIAHELQPLLPDVDLGKEFTGAWAQFPEIAGSMIVLSLFGASGGMNNEARARAFAEAPRRTLIAAGYTPESIDAIEAAKAKGQSSLNAAVDGAQLTRDANTPEAAAAAAEEAAEVKEQQAAMEVAQRSNLVPRVIQTADGMFSVIDNETQEVIATVDDQAAAMRILSTHSEAMDEKRTGNVEYLTSLMEAGQEILTMDKTGQAQNSLEVSTVYTEAIAAAEDPASIDQFQTQAVNDELIQGGTGNVARVALGRNVPELRNKVRTYTNRLFNGASVTTIVHEMGHGMLRELEAAGVIVRDEKLAFVKALNEVIKGKTLKRGRNAGQKTAILPEGIADADITDDMLNEGISWAMEMELLATRKQEKADKAIQASPKVISRNLLALARLAPGATKKFLALRNAMRGVLGLTSARVLLMQKGFREGRFDMESHKAFLDKLTGRDLQGEHNTMVREQQAEIVGDEVVDEAAPLSLVPEDPKKKAARRKFTTTNSRHVELFQANPFVASILEQGGMMSASRARKEFGKAWWDANDSQYDDAPSFKNPTFNAIYSKGGQLTPNQIADGIAADGLMPDGHVNRMWAELRKAADSTTNQNKQTGVEMKKQEANERLSIKQGKAFEKANQPKRKGVMEFAAGDHEPGFTVTIGGEVFTVLENDGEFVTLKDGDKINRERAPTVSRVWVKRA